MINRIPIRLDYYQYCAETWLWIFKQLPLHKINTIIDLCCGWSPKLELALLKTDFSGTLYSLDKSEENLDIFKFLIDPFPKKFLIKTKVFNLFKQQTNNFLKKADLILANHIIDDLLIDYFQMKYGIKENNIFEHKAELIKTWKEILARKNIENEIILYLTNFFNSYLKKGGYIIFSQYPSYQEKLFRTKDFSDYCIDNARSVYEILIHNGAFRGYSLHFEDKSAYFKNNHMFCLKKIRQASPLE